MTAHDGRSLFQWRCSASGAMAALLHVFLVVAVTGCGSADEPSDPGPSTRARDTGARGGEGPRPTGRATAQGHDEACRAAAVHFRFDSAELDRSARETLTRNVDCLRRLPRLRVVGMADPRGTEEYNLALGERRARAVTRYIQAQGVGSDADVHSVGDHLATGTDETGWRQDRRVEMEPQSP